MIFADSSQFIYLLLIPISLIIYSIGLKIKNRKQKTFFHKQFKKASFPYKESILISCTLLCLVIAKADPKYGNSWTHQYKSKVDIVVALDLSNSMLATDTNPNRLTAAKKEIKLLLQKLKGHRIALVGFSKNAFTHVPLTYDHSIVTLFLDELDPGFNSNNGTGYEDLLVKSSYLLRNSKENERILLIFSDGELTNTSLKETINIAKKNKIHIISIGIGTHKGSPIPIEQDNLRNFLKRSNGDLIISKFNEDSLKTLSQETNGKFVKSKKNQLASLEVYKSIKTYEQHSFKKRQKTEQTPRYHLFIFIAVLLMIASTFVNYSKSKSHVKGSK